jgi:tRNA U34 5-methylaminomethyl-2-thiouridine-forming methyltransferase MnmC
MERKIITTDDGSHSIYIPDLKENYHSTHGAIQESLHVFIEAGLKKVLADNLSSVLNVLEVGMGTGLNLLLSYIETKEITVSLKYTSIEAYPLDKKFIQQLNYAEILSSSLKIPLKGVFEKIHDCEWDQEVELSENFTLKKIKNKLQEVNLKANTFDLIYYDAFGPPTQPEMWTDEIFTSLFSSLKNNGCLVTYCAKGEVKRILKRAGFTIESLPGPPGKREMIRALKIVVED